MIALLLAAATALILSLVGTPLLIRVLRARNIGQLIREDGPSGHATKAGTPTMGGLAIVGAAVAGYIVGDLRPGSQGFQRSGVPTSDRMRAVAAASRRAITRRAPGQGPAGPPRPAPARPPGWP